VTYRPEFAGRIADLLFEIFAVFFERVGDPKKDKTKYVMLVLRRVYVTAKFVDSWFACGSFSAVTGTGTTGLTILRPQTVKCLN
jgi:hypothetical protein